ncbi:Shedu immune nuclease family protein [Actinomyces slackii]|nr:Shedu immune nuclease family protein [Actinomyces slackii]
MIIFVESGNELVLRYFSELQPAGWVDERLKRDGQVGFKRVFSLNRDDLIENVHSVNGESDDEDSDDFRDFRIGVVDGEYWRIRADVLGINHDALIAQSIDLSQGIFVAERNISVFRRIERVACRQIVIGGGRSDAIPEEEFWMLLKRFPTSTECRLYVDARVGRIVQEYYESAGEAERKLQRHLNAKKSTRYPARRTSMIVNEMELEKFTFVRERFEEMLADVESYSERDWQVEVARLFCLMFPRYVCVLEGVKIKERFSRPGKEVRREVDMVLVDSAGTIDILEIKKPFSDCLVSRGRYRDNYIPKRELAGAVVQCEKYLFYLNCGGVSTEEAIQKRLDKELANAPRVKIVNPKAYILAGRDDNLTDEQRFDFEFTRRGGSGIMDIITYDDLMRRLYTMTEALRKQIGDA